MTDLSVVNIILIILKVCHFYITYSKIAKVVNIQYLKIILRSGVF